MKSIVKLLMVTIVLHLGVAHAMRQPSARTRATQASRANIRGISQIEMQQLDQAKKYVQNTLDQLNMGKIEASAIDTTALKRNMDTIKKHDSRTAADYQEQLAPHQGGSSRSLEEAEEEPEKEDQFVEISEKHKNTNKLLDKISQIRSLVENIQTNIPSLSDLKPAGYKNISDQTKALNAEIIKLYDEDFDKNMVIQSFGEVVELLNEKFNERTQAILARANMTLNNTLSIVLDMVNKNSGIQELLASQDIKYLNRLPDIINNYVFELVESQGDKHVPMILSKEVIFNQKTRNIIFTFIQTLAAIITQLKSYTRTIVAQKNIDRTIKDNVVLFMSQVLVPIYSANNIFQAVVDAEATVNLGPTDKRFINIDLTVTSNSKNIQEILDILGKSIIDFKIPKTESKLQKSLKGLAGICFVGAVAWTISYLCPEQTQALLEKGLEFTQSLAK